MKFYIAAFSLIIAATVAQEGFDKPEGNVVELSGLIKPMRVVNLSAGVNGLISEVKVDLGDTVKEGQVVAVLESSVEMASVNLAKIRTKLKGALKSGEARLDFSKKKLKQSDTLSRNGIISPEEFDTVLTEKLLAESALIQAKENIEISDLALEKMLAEFELRTVRSTIDGVIIERFLSPGELVNASQAVILKIAQINPLRIDVQVPLDYLGKINIGREAKIRPEAPIKGDLKARVLMVDPMVDTASSTFNVRLSLPNPEYKINPGLKCKVLFNL